MIDSATPELFEACLHGLILGIVQGLTEFLPISSTAHLKVVPIIAGWRDPGVSFTAVAQLGSTIAVAIYFRSDLANALHGISIAIRCGQWHEPRARLGSAVVIGTLPILLVGSVIRLFWRGNYEFSPLRGVPSIAITSIVMSLLLAIAECIGSRQKCLLNVCGRDGIVVGLAQTLALIPGASRSGSTLTISLLDGWQRTDAAHFSFLLSIPAVTLAGLVELQDATVGPYTDGVGPLLISIISAAVVSWLTIDSLLKFLQKHSTWVFVLYRMLFGITLLTWYLPTFLSGSKP